MSPHTTDLITPHGNAPLVERILPLDALHLDPNTPSLTLTPRESSDLEMLATGALSPLQGFMTRPEYDAVVENMHLPNGIPWSVPITLSASRKKSEKFREGDTIVLRTSKGRTLGILTLSDLWAPDKTREASQILGTTDPNHPSVRYLQQEAGEIYLGGKISLLASPSHDPALDPFWWTPSETRRRIAERGWKTVVAFQTRNPMHRAHEYLTKCALEMVDGLLIHPLVGQTKPGDLSATTRMRCYQKLVECYYNPDRVLLSVNPAAMRYAGPAEAIFHAIVRRNYGCTHFIVGRDHAGVGNYYGTYDAQKIFERFDADALGIQPICFEHAFYDKSTRSMATEKTAPPHGERITLSGSKVRAMLAAGEYPPEELVRPEIAAILMGQA